MKLLKPTTSLNVLLPLPASLNLAQLDSEWPNRRIALRKQLNDVLAQLGRAEQVPKVCPNDKKREKGQNVKLELNSNSLQPSIFNSASTRERQIKFKSELGPFFTDFSRVRPEEGSSWLQKELASVGSACSPFFHLPVLSSSFLGSSKRRSARKFASKHYDNFCALQRATRLSSNTERLPRAESVKSRCVTLLERSEKRERKGNSLSVSNGNPLDTFLELNSAQLNQTKPKQTQLNLT